MFGKKKEKTQEVTIMLPVGKPEIEVTARLLNITWNSLLQGAVWYGLPALNILARNLQEMADRLLRLAEIREE